jgi:hypothetical protein
MAGWFYLAYLARIESSLRVAPDGPWTIDAIDDRVITGCHAVIEVAAILHGLSLLDASIFP